MESNHRFCNFCPDKIEDEVHFLFNCPILNHLRNTYIDPIINEITGFEYFPDGLKLKAMMIEMKYHTCKFIADAMDLRNYLVSKPRTLG